MFQYHIYIEQLHPVYKKMETKYKTFSTTKVSVASAEEQNQLYRHFHEVLKRKQKTISSHVVDRTNLQYTLQVKHEQKIKFSSRL
jgi:hypothetical protein